MTTRALHGTPDSLRQRVATLRKSPRVSRFQDAIRSEPRVLSIDQARLITGSYRDHPEEPRVLQRAYALAASLDGMPIRIDPSEAIVGNRTPEIRAGVVFPEAGLEWVDTELETLPTRRQDSFRVRPEDAAEFRKQILPAWRGNTLEHIVDQRHGAEIAAVKSVVKINQTDHAQGHICPNTERWLRLGPAAIQREAEARLAGAGDSTSAQFLRAVAIVLSAARRFILRYADEAERLRAGGDGGPGDKVDNGNAYDAARLADIASACRRLADHPPQSFHEAVQSTWFLYVILQMESNASSFSPGRLDQTLMPYLQADLDAGAIDIQGALDLIEDLWLSFNKIVYMRSASSAEYFAGFPIGFNVACGGVDSSGRDATNLLSFLFLKAQEHIGLPQPNLSARLWKHSPEEFVDECARVIGLGSGMPQIVNDESIIPALQRVGISEPDARNYAVVGCVELSTQGNNLGWSDAAMFNLVKALELATNDGVCTVTGERLGPATGELPSFDSFAEFTEAFRRQVDHFVERMMPLCDAVDRLHAEVLPSPFLSSVIDDCLDRALDVTAGGARYNLSGIQAIQVANVADSLAALKSLVFHGRHIDPAELLDAMRSDFNGREPLRRTLIEKAPKYGNDVGWVDELGNQWARYVAESLSRYRNARGGPYHMGLYTVSAHVPMGKNVGATPDGRRAGEPLADGGMSAVYGRDTHGPTALLRSVSRIDSLYASNGTLLNMKFLPRTFRDENERRKFGALLRSLLDLGIHHVQFNVVNKETLLRAKEHPEEFENLTIRVAGYTAYFVELADDLQDEIIVRTAYAL